MRWTLLLIVCLSLASPLAIATISVQPSSAHVGDLVHITIVPALQDQTLVIITPKDTYRFIGGIPQDAAFIPDTPGVHTLRIIDNNVLVDSATFTVIDGTPSPEQGKQAAGLTVSSNEIRIGEPFHIDAPADVVITIADGTEEFRYSDPARPITFIPPRAGVLDISAKYPSGRVESASVIVKEVDPLVQAQEPQDTVPSVIIQDKEAVQQTTPGILESRPVAPGKYDIEVKDVTPTLRKVRFGGLSYNNTPLRVTGVDTARINGNARPDAVDAFAIDPTGMEFESASVTFKAAGIALYKCVQYDYSTQTCSGENVKVMDLVPGQEYTIPLTAQDPLYTQTGYLVNPNFDTTTNNWTTFNSGTSTGTFAWTATDGSQSGLAQVTANGKSQNVNAGYHQVWNLSIPQGTTLISINVSAIWRISSYSAAGSINITVENVTTNTSLCYLNRSFTAITNFSQANITTGSGGCSLASFTPNANYRLRLRCIMTTVGGPGGTEVCRWDNASIIVTYNDTSAPTMRNATDTPDPVEYNQTLNITVNITDNIAMSSAIIELFGTNYSLRNDAGNIYYYSGTNTTRAPGTYQYRIYANDTNENWLVNTSSGLNFTIVDTIAPNITLIGPSDDNFTNIASFTALYNLSDQLGVSNCSLNLSGTVRNSTANPSLFTTLNFTAQLPSDATYYWNITCNDTSNNRNTSVTRNITRDTAAPAVLLGQNGTVTNNVTVLLGFTPQDQYLQACSLWTDTTGSWALNATNATPANGAVNVFAISPPHGVYKWNVRCADRAGNGAFNATNYTINVDRVAPISENMSISPASGVPYAQGADYTFNLSWADRDSNVSAVYLETDFGGAIANVTPARNGDVYTYTFTDKAAGSYVYRWYGIDAAGNVNSTTQAAYTIAKAQPALNLTLNGSYANFSGELDETVNSTARAMIPLDGYIELYRDGVRLSSGAARLENITTLSVEKRYNYTVLYNATQNYSAHSLTLFADVVDKTPPTVTLDSPSPDDTRTQDVSFLFTPHDNVDIANCTVLLDGISNRTSPAARNIQQNITITGIGEGVHNWTVNCSDTSNNSYTNASVRNFTVDTTPPTAFDLTSPAPGSITASLTTTFNWTQTSDLTFDRYTILVDNDVNFGSVNNQSNITPITNTSVRLTLSDQGAWYWKVVAYDRAGNTRTSNQVWNYTTDATAPAIALTTGNDTYYAAASLTLNYTASDFTMTANCSLYIDNSFNQTNSSPGSFTIPVAEGTHSWRVACGDVAGNQGTSQTYTFTIDRTPPSIFATTSPADNTTSSNAAPTYTWEQTTDPNFANYTVEVSDNSTFPYINYSLPTLPITNTSVTQDPALADGTWYWRVVAYDRAGNNRTIHPTYTVDTTPPSAFTLTAPPDGTENRSTQTVLSWEQTNDPNFANYTVLLSDSSAFAYVNITTATYQRTNTSTNVTLTQNVRYYWKVIAYDLAGNSRNSTATFSYLADYMLPNITLISPNPGANITNSPLVQFRFNVSDVGSLDNCSLYLNSTLDKTINGPTTGTTLTISSNLENGFYLWYVSCTDISGNTGNSTTRNITVDTQVPTQVLYESSPGTVTFTPPALINLSSNDGTESSAAVSVSSGLSNLVNATYTAGGQGLLLLNGTLFNITGVFSASRAGEFTITWKVLMSNSSGTTLLCQSGNDGATGTSISNTPKQTYNTTCSMTSGDVRLQAGNNLTLVVDAFKSTGATRTLTHYWENTSDSVVRFKGYTLGILNVSSRNSTDPSPSEGTSYVEQCNATCTSGTCLTTDVYLQLWNGSSWVDVGTNGNITLNGTQLNPESIGNLNSSTLVDFSLYGAQHSNSTLRCYATSTYSNATGAAKNVSVVDRTPPNVALVAPSNNAAFEPQSVTFQYLPADLRLSTCSLWGNWSGAWAINQTRTSANASVNSFNPVNLGYGVYQWNVQCNDTAGNSGFAPSNYTLYIAGDLAVYDMNISFTPLSPAEGQNVTLIANITNRANRTEPAVTVQFWHEDPLSGGTQIGTDRTIRIQPLSFNTTSVTWTAEMGSHDIYVIVDPPLGSGSIVESNESNNVANRSISISMWQLYYGNVSGNITLGTYTNRTFVNWQFVNQSGNIFITDTDTTNGISFIFLQGLGRNTIGGTDPSTQDDFAELDAAINTTSFSDSVNRTYASGTTEQFMVFGRDLTVPVINTSGNFTTGVLWDTDDSANSYYDGTDKEDIIFITRIRNMSQGRSGPADYEITIPSRLKAYKGASSTVSFYYELQ